MNKILNKVRYLVKDQFEETNWKYHIVPCIKYAKKLAKIFKINEEVAELAALLHDIGRLKFGKRDHHITGVVEAEKILKKYKVSQNIIDDILHAIESHRGSINISPKTMLAKIIANADAMAHFDMLPIFFYWRADKKTFEKTFLWVDNKMKRGWKKMTLPEAQEIMKKKYESIRLLLDSVRGYI
ncbi:MAG: hypothetical protein AMS24_04910 [Chlamydiae bacterium SM23_39]|nr:MAG: hypothetical protein AMS24_04910 [Chlamydiae bacterium SM23_39]